MNLRFYWESWKFVTSLILVSFPSAIFTFLTERFSSVWRHLSLAGLSGEPLAAGCVQESHENCKKFSNWESQFLFVAFLSKERHCATHSWYNPLLVYTIPGRPHSWYNLAPKGSSFFFGSFSAAISVRIKTACLTLICFENPFPSRKNVNLNKEKCKF